jgi:hypothetical protein
MKEGEFGIWKAATDGVGVHSAKVEMGGVEMGGYWMGSMVIGYIRLMLGLCDCV